MKRNITCMFVMTILLVSSGILAAPTSKGPTLVPEGVTVQEFDTNDDGKIDKWAHQEAGDNWLTMESDLNYDGQVDSWVFLAAGCGGTTIVNADSDHDGKVDTIDVEVRFQVPETGDVYVRSIPLKLQDAKRNVFVVNKEAEVTWSKVKSSIIRRSYLPAITVAIAWLALVLLFLLIRSKMQNKRIKSDSQ